jgi:hypothetical protein
MLSLQIVPLLPSPYSEKVITDLDTQIAAIKQKIQEEIDNYEQTKSRFATEHNNLLNKITKPFIIFAR